MDAEAVQAIVMNIDEIYSISTRPGKRIIIKTRSYGEYYNQIKLRTERNGETLFLTSGFREILQSGFDKLSTHKVFSMEVELEIPELMRMEVMSNLASVYARGVYENMIVQLKSGSCYLNDFTGNATVNTYNGNIQINSGDVVINANSRNGILSVPENTFGNYTLDLSSINGDIRVAKTK